MHHPRRLRALQVFSTHLLAFADASRQHLMKRIHPTDRSDPPRAGGPPRRLVCLAAVLLIVLSCANYKRIAPDEIEKGNHVHIAMWGGGTKRFEVRDVRDGLVVGKKIEVAMVEIKDVRRRLPLVDDAEDAGVLVAIANSLYYLFSLSWVP